jgi:3-deoxy-D-manno-octulosonic-acid transferase
VDEHSIIYSAVETEIWRNAVNGAALEEVQLIILNAN